MTLTGVAIALILTTSAPFMRVLPPARAAEPEPVPISEAASALAEIRATRKAAEADAAAAQARADEAGTRLAGAEDTVAATAAVDRSTRKHAEAAAEDARIATTAESKARAAASGAEEALSRMARNAYINAMANSDLELFASFAADGPEALNAIARRDMAYDNLGDASLVEAQRTVRVAEDAGVVADQQQAAYESAAQEHARAHDEFLAARRAATDARDDLAAAKSDLGDAEEAIVAADKKYDKAQEVYKAALEKSLAESGGGAPISQGPAADVVWKMLKAEGFTEESIAGILGNLQQESGVDPTAVQGGGPGRGLAQWSMGGRWDNGPQSLISFASSQGLDPWDARTQVRFMVYEMDTVLTSFDLEGFKDMTDILAATVYFHDVFEGSADSAEFVRAVRGNYALQWYARLS